jgi:hypothetical protein
MCKNIITELKINRGIKRAGNETFNLSITVNPKHLKTKTETDVIDIALDAFNLIKAHLEFLVYDKLPAKELL